MSNTYIKNNITMCGFGIAACAVMAVMTLVGNLVFNVYSSLIFSIVIMLCAIPLHILGAKTKINVFFIVGFLFNAVGSGAAANACFLGFDKKIDSIQLFEAAAIAAVLILVYTVFLNNMRSKKVISILCFTIAAAMTVTALVCWINTDITFFRYGFLAMIWVLFYLCVFIFTANRPGNVYRYISFGGFCACLLVIIAAAIIVSEGDFLSDLDFDIDGGTGKKKMKRK